MAPMNNCIKRLVILFIFRKWNWNGMEWNECEKRRFKCISLFQFNWILMTQNRLFYVLFCFWDWCYFYSVTVLWPSYGTSHWNAFSTDLLKFHASSGINNWQCLWITEIIPIHTHMSSAKWIRLLSNYSEYSWITITFSFHWIFSTLIPIHNNRLSISNEV